MNELYQRAQDGVKLIEASIVELLRAKPNGLSNTEITKHLGLESDQGGKQKDYLAWSVLGRMMKSQKIERTSAPGSKQPVYRLK